jgi:formylglycine-generating enzyme required for sulfatase activity
MNPLNRSTLVFLLASGLPVAGCSDDGGSTTDGSETNADSETKSGDGDGDPGDGDPGDGDPGDGDPGDGDGDPDDGLCHGSCGDLDCGTCPDGPTPIDAGRYSIDATEMTNGYYDQFLAVEFSPAYLPELMGPGCDWKSDFTPLGWTNTFVPSLPVVGVDWCDAIAYCSWAGKHLCGQIGGSPAMIMDVENPVINEWYRACTNAGTSTYPYGQLYNADACNTVDAGFEQMTLVGSLAACEGGLTGLFDMSGNVWEWTNACKFDAMMPSNLQECRRRGGSYFSDGPTSRCGIDSVRPRDLRNNNVGFRCCQ